ncbi:HipA N-terminal domain-containing protein [Desulfobacula phenolica]|uniref:HipA N-terminal domain-containing protein n=1 Tax=Desulfobacula phenolica TaxID=90732 RepID=UPI003898E7D4
MNVFFEQTRVGSLSINDRRQFPFQYSKKWLTSPDAFQISISLPMQEEIFPHNKVKSFFSNLLPEAAVRILIAKQLGISDKNDFMLLKRIGGECAGAQEKLALFYRVSVCIKSLINKVFSSDQKKMFQKGQKKGIKIEERTITIIFSGSPIFM